MTRTKTKVYRPTRADQLLDAIKDETDRLHEIKSNAKRREAARDLVEYIQLHHLDGQG